MKEPRWLSRRAVELMHQQQLDEHGGSFGVRDEGTLESALARARNRFLYEADADLATLAACHAFALATSHPFTDGNTRTAFVTAAVFLRLNGYELLHPEPSVFATFLQLAAGELTEDELAAWFREGMRPL
ncbi:MAG: type II toxin-antitoxin system death-on-curing family toxin [Gemmatimonadaceae bacterium]|nr:type II toxin-antitoxin system death-on-curing family toxin [Gemmatimonadaceae bacterium]